MTVDIQSFAASEEEFAVRVKRDDLPGLLRKRLEVPPGALALVRPETGDAAVLEAGGESSELKDAVVVKGRLRLELELDAGRSKDDTPVRVRLGLDVRPRGSAIDLGQLEQNLLGDRAALARTDVQAYFEPYVRDAVRFYVGEREVEALVTKDQRAELEEHLRGQLEKALFEAGVELSDVLHPEFGSEDYEARRQARAEADSKAAALAKEKELLDMKKQLDLEAVLAGIEVKDEADRARKERRLERYEQIRTRMGDDDVKALIMLLDDDGQRATLIRELIEKDATPEQRAAMQVNELESAVEGRLIELQQKLAQLSGAELTRRDDDPITKRILCVVGKRVLAFDPKTNLHPEVPKEVYDTENATLGYLRSVRAEQIEGEEWLLAGAQRGIYRMTESEVVEYPFPREPEGKGGANAVAYFDGRLFATHSELGLTEWPLGGGEARALCEAVTSEASATRGAQVFEGRLYFSAGRDVFALDLATGSDTPTRYKGSDDSITSFVALKGELVAGNRSGKLYRWDLDDPGSPQALNVLKKNPVYMLRQARIAGQGFYVIGSKDFTVTVCAPQKDIYRDYQAREEVRWVDGAADFIVGVSRSGYKVFCWDAHRQSDPVLTIRVSDKVQDLYVVKTLPKTT